MTFAAERAPSTALDPRSQVTAGSASGPRPTGGAGVPGETPARMLRVSGVAMVAVALAAAAMGGVQLVGVQFRVDVATLVIGGQGTMTTLWGADISLLTGTATGMIWMMGLWLSLWYPSDGYCLFEGVGDSSAAGSIYVQCLGAFSPAGGLVVDSHFMGYWRIAVNGDGHWNDLDDGMWLSLWYPSGGYCLFEGVGDSSAAGSIYVQCLGAFSPAGGLVIDTHFMGYWHLVVNGDGHWNDLDDGMWLSLWYPSDGYCLFECVGDSSTARFLGVSWIRLTLAPSPCTVLMVITHAGGLVFFDLDMSTGGSL
ncbi:hypothetical protein CYMTET_13843 [Cymbomonas tetramitiformis]|uniref:Uncharacterized protein n=1 Tax=Cymbomonas tetramitiformis TaxID=36881 RepID=A0AAE0GHQ6_9CHLO|nr:hypothetical protein CYMTET_13843 [Cymbomonas tetramitiformis]